MQITIHSFWILKKVPAIHKDSAYYTHDYSNFDKDSLLDDFSKISWDDHDNIRPLDINEKFHNFHRKVTSCVTTHVPIIKVSRKKLALKAKPWISNRIEHMMAKRDRYLRKFNRTFNKDIKYLYKKFRNKVVSELRKSKTEYHTKYFDTHKSNMKQLWAGIRSIVELKYKVGSCISYFIHENVKVEDSKGTASIFNNVYVSTANKINEKISGTRKSPLDFLTQRSPNSFFVSPVTPIEIQNVINSFKSGKAVGPFSIPISLLKLLCEYISIPLCEIINESFISGIFPDPLKLAKVIPLYKRQSPDDPSNYRPISLLSIFSKIIEKLMYNRLYNFFEDQNVLYSLQFGFRAKHSTLHALISMTECIKKTIDDGMFGIGVFIDIQKAFDTVNHSILLKKLEHYGIRGVTLDWFSSYLSERKQYVSINGHSSEKLAISCGVPQGSVLGPLLFLIYINDLPNVSKYLSFFLFADDTNIYFKHRDLAQLQKIMNQELKKVRKWLDAHRLSLNIDKTNFVVFHSPQIKLVEPVIIRFGKKKIKRESCVKFLGIVLDANLSWKYHIAELSKKLSRSIGAFL